MISAIVDAKWHLGVEAVDRARRRIGERQLALSTATVLEHVEEAADVRLDVGVGILERITHACLRRQVNKVCRLELVADLKQFGAIRNVYVHVDDERNFKRRCSSAQETRFITSFNDINASFLELGLTRSFQSHIVVRVEIVVSQYLER